MFHSSELTFDSLPMANSSELMAGSPAPKVKGPIRRDERPDIRLSVLTCGLGWMYAVTNDVHAETRETPMP